MAEEGIKQLQNKRKEKSSSVSRNRKNERKEIKGFMKKEQRKNSKPFDLLFP